MLLVNKILPYSCFDIPGVVLSKWFRNYYVIDGNTLHLHQPSTNCSTFLQSGLRDMDKRGEQYLMFEQRAFPFLVENMLCS